MKVVVKKVGCKPQVKEMKDDLDEMQKIVGGHIEVVPIGVGIILVCNDEGKLIGLPANFIFVNDVICGDVFFVSECGEDFKGLSDEQIQILLSVFK